MNILSVLPLLLHSLSCLLSLSLGFRLSRLLLLLFLSPHHHPSLPPQLSSPPPPPPPPPRPPPPSPPATARPVGGGGRHGISVRPISLPDPADTARAFRILAAVHAEQRRRLHPPASPAHPRPRPLLVVTPTLPRPSQFPLLSSLAHSLLLLPSPLTWLLVEPPSPSPSVAASLLARFPLPILPLRFPGPLPADAADSRMRLHALRVIRERRMEGIVIFADDSNVHSLEFFDEVQKVKWMGAVSIGMLAHSGSSGEDKEEEESLPVPIQGPACNASGRLVGWHTFNSSRYAGKIATVAGEEGMVLPARMEWAGFVLDSRLVWKAAVEGRPDWVWDLDEVGLDGDEVESPLDLLKDAAAVEPLGNCGKKVMLWSLWAEARCDSKYPPGWIINPPLDIVVPAKRTPWPDVPPELPPLRTTSHRDHAEKRPAKSSRSSRPRRSSRSKRKRDSLVDPRSSPSSQRH